MLNQSKQLLNPINIADNNIKTEVNNENQTQIPNLTGVTNKNSLHKQNKEKQQDYDIDLCPLKMDLPFYEILQQYRNSNKFLFESDADNMATTS